MSSALRAACTLILAAGLSAGVPAAAALAQTRAEIRAASSMPVLDLSTGPTEAIQAAKAGNQPKAAPAAPAPRPADTVETLTVSPESTPKGRVVASTAAASLTSPNYSAEQAKDQPMAVGLGGNASVGAQKVDNTHAEGFLKVNPQGPVRRTDVGLTNVF